MANTQKFTRQQIIDALEATGGFITYAAKILGCHYVTVEDYIRKDPSIGVVNEHIKETRLDIAEDVIMTAMDDKEDMREAKDAAKFYLRYKGRQRGYIKHEKVEITDDLSKLMEEAEKNE